MNKELELAKHFVSKTNRNIFVTGKAGTGKTTFLKELQQDLNKRMVVVAPTGVAAINARGVTIHSFFQLPFGPIIPNGNNTIQRKFNRKKINLIKSLDLVIIDEISMVRADILDGIDEVLRRYKDRLKPFGGAQMLFIGDLQQLSPVIRPNEWELLKSHYNNAYFFSSLAYQQAVVIPVELKHIYRQQDENFIRILNEIRTNTLSDFSSEILNKQFQPDFISSKSDGYITLTTHNNRAQIINQEHIDKLKTKSKKYKASITGNFAEKIFPVDESLELKIGAQVMFVKNDSSIEKRYFNGKIGTVIGFEKESVTVQCENEFIDAGVEMWGNITYSLDDKTDEITEKVEGTYTQIPLRLAWAITIHKSQGLTFEKAIIDAEASFAHGQTYVALSRCKTLEGIVLKSKIRSSSIINDSTVNSFNKEMEDKQADEKQLSESKKNYQLELISDLFNYNPMLYPINRLIDLYYRNQTVLEGNTIEPLLKIKDDGIIALMKVASGFKKQLIELSDTIEDPQNDKEIQERFNKARDYFKKETENKISLIFEKFSYSTDNQSVTKDITRALDNFEELLNIKKTLLANLKSDFSIQEFLRIRTKAILQKPDKKEVKTIKTVTSTEHKELFEKLLKLRTSIATNENIGAYGVYGQKTLFELCELLPQNKEQLSKVNGMGKIRIDKYGIEILEVIKNYTDKNGLSSQIELIKVEKPEKGSSKKISLELFQEGLSIKEIVAKRGLVQTTIEGHLSDFVADGTINISELLPEVKIRKGTKIIEDNVGKNLNELKNIAGNDFSYIELRMLINSVNATEN